MQNDNQLPRITLIAAMASNRVIGKDNKLIWHIPEDLQHFKETTLGSTVVMGRKTFESLPGILPDRQHVVLTRGEYNAPQGVEVVNNLEQVLSRKDKHIFIMGGEEIYRLFLPIADSINLTEVLKEFEGDTMFPEFEQDFNLDFKSPTLKSKELSYTFNLYKRK